MLEVAIECHAYANPERSEGKRMIAVLPEYVAGPVRQRQDYLPGWALPTDNGKMFSFVYLI